MYNMHIFSTRKGKVFATSNLSCEFALMKTRQALFGLFIYALDPILESIRVEIVVCIENYTLQLNGLRNSLKNVK